MDPLQRPEGGIIGDVIAVVFPMLAAHAYQRGGVVEVERIVRRRRASLQKGQDIFTIDDPVLRQGDTRQLQQVTNRSKFMLISGLVVRLGSPPATWR